MRTVLLSLCFLLGACTSVANIRDLPTSSSEIDFDKDYSDAFAVYARVDITQSFTGGWKENRAKQVLDSLCGSAPCKPTS